MAELVQRGRIVYLKPETHRRLLPNDDPKKMGKRPFVVIQSDIQNEFSSRTIVVPVTGWKKSQGARSNSTDVDFPDAMLKDSRIQCGSPYTVEQTEIRETGGALDSEMLAAVDNALRLAMDLDPDSAYQTFQDRYRRLPAGGHEHHRRKP